MISFRAALAFFNYYLEYNIRWESYDFSRMSL